MSHFQSTSRLSLATFFIITMYVFSSFTAVYAKAGCCSKHGGVVGCNNATGYQSCKDGTTSPSCTCSGQTIKQSKAASTKVKPASTLATAIQTTLETVATAKGCCSGHGGVAKCDTKTGYKVCKDGTHSTSCTCEKGKSKSKKK